MEVFPANPLIYFGFGLPPHCDAESTRVAESPSLDGSSFASLRGSLYQLCRRLVLAPSDMEDFPANLLIYVGCGMPIHCDSKRVRACCEGP